MKRIFTVLVLLFVGVGLATVPIYAAEETAPNYDEEVVDFQLELNETLTLVFAWIGGFSGFAAVFAFVLRFIKDKKVMSVIRDQINTLGTSTNTSADNVNKMIEVINAYSKREEAMEKMMVNMISLSNLNPKIKAELIEGLKNDTITVDQVLESNIVYAKEEDKKKEETYTEIKKQTSSLLEQLANEK